MATRTVTKAARAAAAAAAKEVQRELQERARGNTADLAKFLSAREREDAVDSWLVKHQQELVEEAQRRRSAERVEAGRALRSMRDRGESIVMIGRMAGISDKTVRELIRDADAAPADEAPTSRPRLKVLRPDDEPQSLAPAGDQAPPSAPSTGVAPTPDPAQA